jgi:hypothetical protein
VASAFDCQFRGSIVNFPAISIWQAAAEPKCNFFAWLVMHNRVLTAGNLMRKNWPCNEYCPMCLCMQESTEHLLTQCNTSEAVWNGVSPPLSLPNYATMSHAGGPVQWVNYLLLHGSKKRKEKEAWHLVHVLVVNLERKEQQNF